MYVGCSVVGLLVGFLDGWLVGSAVTLEVGKGVTFEVGFNVGEFVKPVGGFQVPS